MVHYPRVIGLRGEMAAGKDETAKILIQRFGYVRMALGDFVKDEASQWLMGSRDLPYDSNTWPDDILDILYRNAKDGDAPRRKPTSPDMRRLLQWLGGDYRRSQNQLYWIEQLEKAWEARPDTHFIVVPDIRYFNEMAWVQAQGGLMWEVVRGSKSVVYEQTLRLHASETELAGAQFDAVIANHGDLAELDRTVTQLYNQVTLG